MKRKEPFFIFFHYLAAKVEKIQFFAILNFEFSSKLSAPQKDPQYRAFSLPSFSKLIEISILTYFFPYIHITLRRNRTLHFFSKSQQEYNFPKNGKKNLNKIL
jgi:hypothetical protein